MEQMNELLKARIAQIKDPVQKILLQDVLADVFTELVKYSDSCFTNLEHKIAQEIQDDSHLYDIYTGVCKKEGLDAASRCLTAVDMVFENAGDTVYEAAYEAGNKIETSSGYEEGSEDGHETGNDAGYETEYVTDYRKPEPGCLGTLFLACKYPDVLQCIKERRRAKVETDQGDYQIWVSLAYSRYYKKAFDWLYQQFGANRRQWHTVNCPFLYKMLDIFDVEQAVPKDAAVLKITIDLGMYSDFAMNDMVLVWNLSKEDYRTRAKEGVAGETAFYEHQLPLQDKQSGHLVLSGEDSVKWEDTFFTIRSGEGLCIRTQKEAYSRLSLLKLNRMDMRKDQTALLYPVQTNHRNLHRADWQAMGQPRYLWTKGEIERMLHSYEVFKDFELADICLDIEGDIKSIDMNPFFKTHSMLKQKRKIALMLHPKDNEDIFQYEKMFFLLAELQMCTEEYEWTGIIRE